MAVHFGSSRTLTVILPSESWVNVETLNEALQKQAPASNPDRARVVDLTSNNNQGQRLVVATNSAEHAMAADLGIFKQFIGLLMAQLPTSRKSIFHGALNDAVALITTKDPSATVDLTQI